MHFVFYSDLFEGTETKRPVDSLVILSVILVSTDKQHTIVVYFGGPVGKLLTLADAK